jgi:type IV secretory pathway TraG/TraD family ATPase VirD4
MSQQQGNELQAGAISTLAGGGLIYASTVIGDQLHHPLAGATNGPLATLDGVMSNGLPMTMAGLGTVMVGWGTYTLTRRLSRRGRVRAKYNNPGWANWYALRKHVSARAMLTVASHTRHSYRHIGWWNRSWYLRRFANEMRRTDYGLFLGKTVVGPEWARSTYASYKDTVMVIAPTQSGKTAWLSGALIDAPGAVVATSTKIDIWRHTYLLRQTGDRPTYLFNPEGLGGEPSTVRWNLVRGCDHYKVAKDRAASMCRGTRTMRDEAHDSDFEFFEREATKILRCFLMAAAISGQDMTAVAKWVGSPASQEPLQILREHGDRVPDGWDRELRQVLNTPAEKTRECIFLTLSQSVEFMSDPEVVKLVVAGPGEEMLDLEKFIESRGTLYLLGKNNHIAPLMVALTQHLFDGASRYASTRPGDRLDPPMSFILDEAALIVPVDLAAWVADSGGRGINLIIAMQALAQLYKIYGERGGQVIQGNANCEMYFGGLSLPEDQRSIADNCGTWTKKVVTHNEGARGKSTSTHHQKMPTIEPADVRLIPPHYALVIYRSCPATLVRTKPVWERRDVRKALRGAGIAIPKAETADGADDTLTPARPSRWTRLTRRIPRQRDKHSQITDAAAPADDDKGIR